LSRRPIIHAFSNFIYLYFADKRPSQKAFVTHIPTLLFVPNRLLEPVQILCIVEHIACLIGEDVADYVERIRQARCRQANERWTGSDGNNL